MGSVSRPPTKTSGSSTHRTTCGTIDQITVSEMTDGIRALRRPTVSTRRPRQGAPTAMPMVMTAAAAPAAA